MARRRRGSQKKSGKRTGSSRKSGDRSAIFWVAGAVFAAMFYIYWQNAGVVNQTAVLEKTIAPTLQTFEIKDKDLTEQTVEKKKIENKRYVHTEKVYRVPEKVSFKQFEAKLKKDLDKSKFKVARSKREVTREADTYHATINYGKYDVMDIKVVKSKAPPPAPPPPPVAVKRPRLAKVAIVLDDFGYTMNNIPLLAEIREPITLAVLPDLPFSKEVARGARARGYEVLLHLPLEAERKNVAEEADTIRSGMSDSVIGARLAREFGSVPGAVGVNNHQGSKGTSDREIMAPIMSYLKRNGLFFLDSMTSAKSVCREVAAATGVPYAKRDVFLDNSNDLGAIEEQIRMLKKVALKKGRAVAIGHDRKNTLIALRRMIPQLRKEGIEIVPVSEITQ